MGSEMGFDMIPKLEKSSAFDCIIWAVFIEDIKKDVFLAGSVSIKRHRKYLEFEVGGHPTLPYQGHKFLRFSSKITGEPGEEVEKVIRDIFRKAKEYFGDKVRLWNDCSKETLEGPHDWEAVRAAERSYIDPSDSRTGQSHGTKQSIDPVEQIHNSRQAASTSENTMGNGTITNVQGSNRRDSCFTRGFGRGGRSVHKGSLVNTLNSARDDGPSTGSTGAGITEADLEDVSHQLEQEDGVSNGHGYMSDVYESDEEEEPKDFTACDKECGYCGHCPY